MPDLWSTITGLASVASLLIAAAERFASWRKYLLPITFATAGFAVGRLSFSVGPSVAEMASDPTGFAVLLLMLVIIAVFATLAVFLLKQGQAMLAYGLVVLVGLVVPGHVIPFYSAAYDRRASLDDYLAVAEVKIHNGDFTGALRFLEHAKRAAASAELRKAIDEQIKVVAGRQLERVKQGGTTEPASPTPQPARR